MSKLSAIQNTQSLITPITDAINADIHTNQQTLEPQACAPSTLTDIQRKQISGQCSVQTHSIEILDDLSAMNTLHNFKHKPRSTTNSSWNAWTTALVTLRGLQGGLGTFIGRLVQEGVRIAPGNPASPEEVDDKAMAAGAVLNLAVGLMAGGRAAVHTWKAMGRSDIYVQSLLGRPPAQNTSPEGTSLLSLGTVGTPQVTASRLRRAAASIAVGTAVFATAAHTGIIALSHIGNQTPGKPDAYKAVWQSNSNAAYAYTREMVNAALDGNGVISHHAMLTPAGVVKSTGQYLVNSLAQMTVKMELELGKTQEFDMRGPALSAVAEIIDVATITASARFSSPEEPVQFLRGHFCEKQDHSQPSQYVTATISEYLDRIVLRGGSRHLIAEISNVIPEEVGAAILRATGSGEASKVTALAGAILASSTHIREPIWQADSVVTRASNNIHAVKDPDPISMVKTNISTKSVESVVDTANTPNLVKLRTYSSISRDIDDIV